MGPGLPMGLCYVTLGFSASLPKTELRPFTSSNQFSMSNLLKKNYFSDFMCHTEDKRHKLESNLCCPILLITDCRWFGRKYASPLYESSETVRVFK